MYQLTYNCLFAYALLNSENEKGNSSRFLYIHVEG